MFGRRRNGLGAQSPVPDPDKYPNLTNYEERFVRPTEPTQPFAAEPAPAFTGADIAQQVAVATERPMVFVSKAHSDIYIYEYSDRLEYYVKTSTCMYKFDTVRKQNG